MGLTAGRDSRMILACSHDFYQKITWFTFADSQEEAEIDVYIARKISEQFAFNHQIVPIQTPSDELKREYLWRIGYSGHWGKARDFYDACSQHLERQSALLTGFAGEVGRAFYWHGVSSKTWQPNPQTLLSLMWLPESPAFCQAIENWLAGISVKDVYLLLDQLYLEQRVGCWASPHLYGVAPFRLVLTPFSHRQIIKAMLRLPIKYKRSQRLADDIINLMWPELKRFPYQRKTGLKASIKAWIIRMLYP